MYTVYPFMVWGGEPKDVVMVELGPDGLPGAVISCAASKREGTVGCVCHVKPLMRTEWVATVDNMKNGLNYLYLERRPRISKIN